AAARGCPARHRAGVRGPTGLRAPDYRGESDRRRAHPEGPAARGRRNRARPRILPAAPEAALRAVPLPGGRGTADARDRAGADGGARPSHRHDKHHKRRKRWLSQQGARGMGRTRAIGPGLLLPIGGLDLRARRTAAGQGPSLYKRLNGREGIALVVGDFVTNMAGDARVNERFKAMKPGEIERVKSNLSEQMRDAAAGLLA